MKISNVMYIFILHFGLEVYVASNKYEMNITFVVLFLQWLSFPQQSLNSRLFTTHSVPQSWCTHHHHSFVSHHSFCAGRMDVDWILHKGLAYVHISYSSGQPSAVSESKQLFRFVKILITLIYAISFNAYKHYIKALLPVQLMYSVTMCFVWMDMIWCIYMPEFIHEGSPEISPQRYFPIRIYSL